MPTHNTYASLPNEWKQLIGWMQVLNFGRIENLAIRNNLPVVSPRPRMIRELKFPGENGPRPESTTANFVLKTQVIELIDQCRELRDGVIDIVLVRHGLPFSMQLEAIV